VRNINIKRLLAVLTVLCILLVPFFAVQAAQDTTDTSKDLEYIRSIMDMIKDKHKGEVTDKQLLEGALKGMFGSMDKYTTYFSIDEANGFMDSVEGKFKGIGVTLSKIGDYVTVEQVFAQSPAEKAGIGVGDRIVSVDGRNAVGNPIESVTKYIKGKKDVKISLQIIKNGDTKPVAINLQKDDVKVNPVTYEIKDNIGYIKLDMFSKNADEFIIKALNDMDEKGVKNIVLDLRDNPGGELDQAVALAEKFIPEGLITKLQYQSKDYVNKEYYSHLKNPKYKLAVLVSGGSASASEVFAGAVKDSRAGTLIGTKTYGKAKVQVMIPLLTPEAYAKYEKQLNVKLVNGYDLYNKFNINPPMNEIIGWTKITVGEYTTPKGNMIDQKGIMPDIETADPDKVKDISLGSLTKLKKQFVFSSKDEGSDVYAAKKLLIVQGYDIDNLDTVMDEKTVAAVMKFQSGNGLYAYGDLDLTTQQLMNEKIQKILDDSDKQYKRAVEFLTGN